MSLHLDQKHTFILKYGKFPAKLGLSFVLKLNKTLPKYGKMQVKSLLETMKLGSLWIKNLFKNSFIQWLMNFLW